MNKEVLLSIDFNDSSSSKFFSYSDVEKSSWIKWFKDPYKLRNHAKNSNNPCEVWIVSNNDIEAINLAAAIKKDSKNNIVCLGSFDVSGSLKSRANNANIDYVFTETMFREKFNDYSNKYNNVITDSVNSNEIYSKQDNGLYNNNCISISILSAAGGTGKSSVSVMLAILSQYSGKRTCLLDCDWQLGDITDLIGSDKYLNIDSCINDVDNIISSIDSRKELTVISSPSFPEMSEKLLGDFPSFYSKLKSMFDVIVVNTGSFWFELQAILLEQSSKNIILLDQRPSTITSTKKILELITRCGIATNSLLFAVNKCNKRCLITPMDVSYSLQESNVLEIKDGGLEVEECLSSSNPTELLDTKNSFAVSLWTILSNFFPNNENINHSTKSKKKNFRRKKSKRA